MDTRKQTRITRDNRIKLWDLEYRGKIVYCCVGLPMPIINSKKTGMLLTGNYIKKEFTVKYHK